MARFVISFRFAFSPFGYVGLGTWDFITREFGGDAMYAPHHGIHVTVAGAQDCQLISMLFYVFTRKFQICIFQICMIIRKFQNCIDDSHRLFMLSLWRPVKCKALYIQMCFVFVLPAQVCRVMCSSLPLLCKQGLLSLYSIVYPRASCAYVHCDWL